MVLRGPKSTRRQPPTPGREPASPAPGARYAQAAEQSCHAAEKRSPQSRLWVHGSALTKLSISLLLRGYEGCPGSRAASARRSCARERLPCAEAACISSQSVLDRGSRSSVSFWRLCPEREASWRCPVGRRSRPDRDVVPHALLDGPLPALDAARTRCPRPVEARRQRDNIGRSLNEAFNHAPQAHHAEETTQSISL